MATNNAINTNSLTNGQLWIGSTGANPASSTLTAGTNISVTNGAGTITIASTGAASFTWNVVTTTSATLAPFNGYIINDASLVTLPLPLTSVVGDTYIIVGLGAGGWKIAQNASQLIHFGSSVTTTGTGGSLASTNAFDSLQLVCAVASTTWLVTLGSQGNITVV